MFSIMLLVFLIVNLVTDSYGQRAQKFFRSDYTYIDAEESFYKIHTIPLTWADAKRVCSLEGATFWHPDKDDEARAVISLWAKIKPKITWMYVGLSDIVVEGIFQTVDGKRIAEVYSTWEPNEPNNSGGNEDCVHIDKEGYMNDDDCNRKLIFTCKKSLRSLEWNHICNMPNLVNITKSVKLGYKYIAMPTGPVKKYQFSQRAYSDYSFSKDTGKCYKLHTTPLKWTEASAICEREQTSLAMINSRLEAYFLVKLTESTPTPRFIENYQRGIFHLGFHNMLNNGWQTVKGSPLDVDDDVWFDNYQPIGYDQCGSMFYTGRLINIDCNMRSFFICENEPDNINSPAMQQFAPQPALLPYVSGSIQ